MTTVLSPRDIRILICTLDGLASHAGTAAGPIARHCRTHVRPPPHGCCAYV